MDQVEIIAAASCAAGFGVGYLLAYTLTQRALIQEITMHVDSVRKIGRTVAKAGDGTVPWSAMERSLNEFPGQGGNRED